MKATSSFSKGVGSTHSECPGGGYCFSCFMKSDGALTTVVFIDILQWLGSKDAV